MNQNKKAVSLSINLVIIVVLGLIVLAVLLYIFAGKASAFQRSTVSCNGECVYSADLCSDGEVSIFTPGCTDSSQSHQEGDDYCCMKLGSES